MKNAGELKHSLSAIKQTRQITNAMYLLSVSEMKKCLSGVAYEAQYMQHLRQTKRELLSFSKDFDHPFKFSQTENGKNVYLVISAEKGMCGSFNTNIANLAEEKIKADPDPFVVMKGSYARTILAPRGIKPDAQWVYPSNYPKTEYAENICDRLIKLYLCGKVSSVHIIYTKYISQLKQEAKCYRLLPLSADFFEHSKEQGEKSPMEFYPSADDVFFNLTRQFATGFIYSAMYQSFVSEHVARMNAMKSATNNADEMIGNLSHKLNSLRQVQITNELIEITSAAGNTEDSF